MTRTIYVSAIIAAALAFLGQVFAADAGTDQQVVTQAGSQASIKGPEQYFTGEVRIDPLFEAKPPDAPFGGAYVTFEPGARSHWHTHPLGQHLIVVAGMGLTGTANGKIHEFNTGDVLWCPKGVKHWHGAAPSTAMTHLAITGTLPDGQNVEWMEPVTDEQYNGEKARERDHAD